MKALLLCAGNGTRLGFKHRPKCMAIVNKKPVLEHLVNHLNKAGITEIIVNIHKNYEPIFQYFGTRLLYLYEPVLLGEAGTERLLKKWLGNEYIVMNGDTLTDINIAKLTANKSTTFMKNGKYAGTKFVWTDSDTEEIWEGEGAYYFDIGSPKKLARARRFYAKKSY